MQKAFMGAATLAMAAFAAWPASAAGTVRIGIILPYSGQFADTAEQLDDGIKLYMQQHGDTVACKKIVVIRKDTGTDSTSPLLGYVDLGADTSATNADWTATWDATDGVLKITAS